MSKLYILLVIYHVNIPTGHVTCIIIAEKYIQFDWLIDWLIDWLMKYSISPYEHEITVP